MSGDLVLWFNPRCSTCQRALELLRARGHDPELRRYLEDPPTVEELRELLVKLGLPPHAVTRSSEDEYQSLRLSERTAPDELLQALSQHPRILQRPILVRGDRAVVARPAERVLEIIDPASP
jgi:arsenate reductase